MRLTTSFLSAMLLTVSAVRAGEPASAPGPVQVWNCGRWQTVSVGDFSGAGADVKSLKPIELIAARNGVASGCVVVTRDGGAITGLKASAGELTRAGGGTGAIPAGNVQVRYADRARPETSWLPVQRFDRLVEEAPAEVPAVKLGLVKGFKLKFTPKSAVPVATVPVWVTVRVPAEAAAGDYEGRLSVAAEGMSGGPVTVPLRLKVHDWCMPAPGDFRVRTIGWTNPEALARHYGAKLWSDQHFKLMQRSMELMLELGSRHLVIDVTRQYPARMNDDTLVKWVKQPDGGFKYDFTLFEKYCDLAEKVVGKPFPLRLNIWRGPRNGGGGEKDDYPNATVLVLDPASGAISEFQGPNKLGSEEMKAFWKPFFDETRKRLEKRGWFDVAGPNWMCYCGGMTPEMASMMLSIWPDGRWLDVTHGRVRSYRTLEKGVSAPVFVQSTVWNEGTLRKYQQWKDGPYPREYAGKFDPTTAWCTHARCQYYENAWPALWTVRTRHELAMLKGNDGLECVGADHFPVKDARGRYRMGEWSAYAQGPKNGTAAILGPGEEGPIGTERFEAMREGIQLCEAMVFIQKAIEAKKLSGELLARANRLLDDRARTMTASYKETGVRNRYHLDLDEYARGSLERDSALYAMAAEVARATGGK